jgi:hypothetical protein
MGTEIKFYTDEHVSGAVVRGLRQRGVDVLTLVEAGMLGASARGRGNARAGGIPVTFNVESIWAGYNSVLT